MVWTSEAFYLAMPGGPYKVRGFTYRGLGLHLRLNGSAKRRRPSHWRLSHLGSGHALVSLWGEFDVVTAAASEIAELGDWDFISLEGWRDRFPDAKERMDEVLDRNPTIAKPAFGSRASHDLAREIAMLRP